MVIIGIEKDYTKNDFCYNIISLVINGRYHMKKKLIMISIILILSSYIVNIIFPIEKVLALDSLPFLSSRNECKGKYEVVIISAGNPPQITGKCPAFTSQSYDNIAHVSCADTYGEAKEIMNNLKSTSTNVASIIYNGTIIDANMPY